MTDELDTLLRQIKKSNKIVTSLVAEYQASVGLFQSPIEVAGKVYFLQPNRFRLDTNSNNREITTIRIGRSIERRLPNRKELWKYDLDDIPQSEPINYGIADLRDPFFLVDTAELIYEGTQEIEMVQTYAFSAPSKGWEKKGLLDTRKGYSIKFQPKRAVARIKVNVDSRTGLLRRLLGVDKQGKELFQASYLNLHINVALDASLFVIGAATESYKVIEAG
jgi:outer membrane lipoprotein-sorting protein